MQSFIYNFIKKPPLLFPLIAVFHLFVTLHAIWTFSDIAFDLKDWLHPLCLVLYTVFWVFVCGMKKWAAYSYIFITIISLLLRFIVHWNAAVAPLFPAEIVCCVLILVYFRRFE